MSRLFTPAYLPVTQGPGIYIRNKAVLSPMCQYMVVARDGVPTDWHLVHLGARAAGGFGIVMTEATAVAPEGRISDRDVGLWNDEQEDAWRNIVRFIRAQGAVAGIQLGHAGGKASTYAWREDLGEEKLVGSIPHTQGGWPTYGPSATSVLGVASPQEMSIDDINVSVNAWAAAAQHADRAGFEVIQIHGAHGYLIHEFLSPLTNQRTDNFGGSFNNRTRYLRLVVEAIRQVWPHDKPLGIRLSGDDWYEERGWQLYDTERLVQELYDLGVTLFDISSAGIGSYKGPFGPGYQVPLAAAVKKALPAEQAFVTAVGMISDPFQAEQILVTEQADGVSIGRAGLREPNWPVLAAVAHGLPEEELPYAEPYWKGNWFLRQKRGSNPLKIEA